MSAHFFGITELPVISAFLRRRKRYDARHFDEPVVHLVSTSNTYSRVLLRLFQKLGFNIVVSSTLGAMLEIVSENPKDCGLICMVSKSRKNSEDLKKYLRGIRMLGIDAPILEIVENFDWVDTTLDISGARHHSTDLPESEGLLSYAIQQAVATNLDWIVKSQERQIEGLRRIAS